MLIAQVTASQTKVCGAPTIEEWRLAVEADYRLGNRHERDRGRADTLCLSIHVRFVPISRHRNAILVRPSSRDLNNVSHSTITGCDDLFSVAPFAQPEIGE